MPEPKVHNGKCERAPFGRPCLNWATWVSFSGMFVCDYHANPGIDRHYESSAFD